jgi:hypothetical protein
MMKIAAVILAFVALGASLIAAYYWFKSASVEFPPIMDTPMNDIDPKIKSALNQTGALNKKAAIWTGIASVFGTVSGVLSTLS